MPYGAQSVISIHQRPLFVRQAERGVSLKRRCYVVCTYGACFQRFKVSPLRCFRVSSHLRCCFKVPGFTASLFQSFIAPAQITYFSVGTMCRPLNSSNPWVPQINGCFILGERRYMSPNDAGHQSLRPCYRTRRVL